MFIETIAPKIISRRAIIRPQTFFIHIVIDRSKCSRSFSTSISTSTTAPKDILKHNATHLSSHSSSPIRAIFPWRHSPHSLDRLDPTLDIYNPDGPGPRMPPEVRTIARLYAEAHLQIPLWESLLSRISYSTNRWEHDLAMQFSSAFGKAVSGMIVDTYHVSNIEKEQEDGSIHVHFDHLLNNNPNEENDDDMDDIDFKDSNSMIQPNLQNLYTAARKSIIIPNAHDADEKKKSISSSLSPSYHIKLETQPLNAKIESLSIIPYLTRAHVQNNPRLKGSFQKVVQQMIQIVNQGSPTLCLKAYELGNEWKEKIVQSVGSSTSKLHYNYTTVAQVSVLCSEMFQVRHAETGEILQGIQHGEKRDVVHLVRFEMVNTCDSVSGELIEMGSWQITDWDDLLDGNIWY